MTSGVLDGFVVHLVDAAVRHPFLQGIAIVAGTFILEDLTTVLAALRVGIGALPMAVALPALWIGVALGDLGLYGFGRLAARHRWARRHIDLDRLERARRWIGGRLVIAVLSSRMMPGMRLPTYLACGFIGVPFGNFCLAVVAATSLWTTLLFGLSLAFGSLVLSELQAWRWPLGVGFGIVLLAVLRWTGTHWSRPVSRNRPATHSGDSAHER
jgi:membrane protein DedA with SNARE-associated domain